MSKYSGYMYRVARFDLTTGKLEDYPWSDKDRELYLGGKVMAAKILYDNLTGQEEALSDENMIVIATGPLTGTGVPSSSRFSVSAISPRTGALASVNCGGSFGYYLKKAGFDAIILTGKCSGHSWLEIYNDSFILHNADGEGIWGSCACEAQGLVRDIVDRDNGCRMKVGILTVGKAGEALDPCAGVSSDEGEADESGLGAVFGWKNLKAIAASGNHEITVLDRKKTVAWNKKWVKALKAHPVTGSKLPKLGTAALAGKGETQEQVTASNRGCLSCPIKCARAAEGGAVKAPELEAIGQMGGYLMNADSKNPKTKGDLTVFAQNIFEGVAASGQCPLTGYAIFPAAVLENGAAKLAPVASFLNKHPGLLFFPIPAFHHDRAMKYAVGMKMNMGKYIICGARGYTLEKCVNGLFGADKGDICPAGEQVDEKVLKAYYAIRGWSKEGVPTDATVKKLGIKKNNG